MNVKHIALILAAAAAAVARAGDLTDAADRQQGIEERTRVVGRQIDSVVAELRSNGIDTENVKTLASIRGVLGQLSDGQMKDVVTLLRHAGDAPNHTGVADAYDGQTRIVNELRDLLTKYQRQAAVDALAAKLSQLADRQNENLKGAVESARRTNGSDPAKFSPDIKDAVHTQQAEQAKIHAELQEAARDLAALAAQPPAQSTPQSQLPDPVADRLKAAAAAMDASKVQQATASAATDLSAGKLFQAVTDEKASRDKLRDLAAAVAPPVDKAAALQKAANQIDDQIKQEKQVADDARKLGRQLAPTTDRKQADVADQTDQTRKALEKASPAAADQLTDAGKSMKAARQALHDHKDNPETEKAARNADAAVDQLEQAKAQVNKELAQATGKEPEAPAQTPADAVAGLRKDEQKLAEQNRHPEQAKPGDDPKLAQTAVAAKTRDLQSDLAEKNPDAAAALDAAAQHMNQAEDQLAQKHPRKAADEQNQAVAQLAKAQAAIDKADKATAQAKADLAQTEAARDQVADAAKKQADATAQPDADSAKQAQAAAAQAADQAAKAVDSAPKEARQAAQTSADQADKSAAAAKQKTDQGDPAGAKPQQQSAQADLQQAKAALDDQVKQMQDKLGIKPDPSQTADAMKDVGDALQKAQQQASQGEQALQGDKGSGDKKDGASQHLRQAAAEAAKAQASDNGQMSAAGKQAMQQAQQHLQKAAEQAKAGDTQQAQEQTEQAKQELQSAASESQAIAAAQLTGQPGDPNQPSDKPGEADNDQPPNPGQGTNKNPKVAMSGDGQPGGVRGDVKGGGAYLGLPPRDRAVAQQSQHEGYPAEYAAMVEQYYRNLSDQRAK